MRITGRRGRILTRGCEMECVLVLPSGSLPAPADFCFPAARPAPPVSFHGQYAAVPQKFIRNAHRPRCHHPERIGCGALSMKVGHTLQHARPDGCTGGAGVAERTEHRSASSEHLGTHTPEGGRDAIRRTPRSKSGREDFWGEKNCSPLCTQILEVIFRGTIVVKCPSGTRHSPKP